ncbi:MAG: hypothetical protein V8R40_11840 [Dysosmobacter sp.]
MELRIDHVSKAYGGQAVLRDVTVAVGSGVTCLMAPSGRARPRCCGFCWGWSGRTAARSMDWKGAASCRRVSGGPAVGAAGLAGQSPLCAGQCL